MLLLITAFKAEMDDSTWLAPFIELDSGFEGEVLCEQLPLDFLGDEVLRDMPFRDVIGGEPDGEGDKQASKLCCDATFNALLLLSLLPVVVFVVAFEFKLQLEAVLLARSVVEPPDVDAFFGLRPGNLPGPSVPR